MIKSWTRYFLPAFRHIIINKQFSLINLLGLSIGLSACLLLIQYAVFEFSFDKFHENSHNIYRIRYDNYRDGISEFNSAAAVPAVGQAMKDNFAEVIEYAWAFPVYNGFFTAEGKTYHENSCQVVTPGFIKIFSWKYIHGDTSALSKPYSVVISKSCALKYFGFTNALGSIIMNEEGLEYTVRGIIEDVPDNSHIKFSMLFSPEDLYDRLEGRQDELWTWYDFNTYILLEEESDPLKFEKKFDQWLINHLSDFWETDHRRQYFRLQQIESIHLYSNLSQESIPDERGNGRLVIILSCVALSILFIAWISYINLSSSMSGNRAKEVGVRMIVGARKRNIIGLFVGESLIMHLFASGLSLVIIELILPSFSRLIERELTLSILTDPWFWIIFTLLLFSGALISGIFPALSILAYKPFDILKGLPERNHSKFILRKILVVIQFLVSIGFISSAFFSFSQLHYMKKQILGIDIDKTIVIWCPEYNPQQPYPENYRNFKNNVKSLKEVDYITASNNIPGVEIFLSEIIQKPGELHGRIIYEVKMDEDYIPSYHLELVSGRNFIPRIDTMEHSVILNISAAKILGYSSPDEAINDTVIRSGVELTIIGVIKDYQQMSVKESPRPLMFYYSAGNSSYISLKFNTQDADQLISEIEDSWLEFYPGKPFKYFILDRIFERQYRIDKQIYRALSIFAALALFIAVLGLIGLSTYTTLRRTKEIAIRKVNGAKISSILVLLVKEYIVMISIAFLIATPLTWVALGRWLDSYPEHINMNWYNFVLSGLIAILFALISVAVQTIRSATMNPSRSLKYE